MLGCGIATGYGAAVNSSAVKPGSRCAVWGVGAVGLAAVLGCKSAGASEIVAIDFQESRLDAGKLQFLKDIRFGELALVPFPFSAYTTVDPRKFDGQPSKIRK